MFGRLFNFTDSEKRAISFQSIWGAGDVLETTTKAGTVINQRNSLAITTVYSCVRLISDTISTLPMDAFRRIDGNRVPFRPKPIWVDAPDIETTSTRTEHYQQVLVSLLLDGNAFIRIIRDTNGIIGLSVLDPIRVTINRDNPQRNIQYSIDGGESIVPRDEMIHITELKLPGQLRGVSRIEQVRESLGLSAALQEFSARFFGQGSITSGLIEFPGNLTEEQAKSLVDSYEQAHRGLRRSHRPGVLSGGAKFQKTGVDPNEAQMLESREFAVEEIARVFRVPLHMLQVAKPGAMSYASVEQNAIQFVTYTLRPYIEKIEIAYSRMLPQGAFIKFNVDGLLRGDIQTRYAAFSTGLQSGFLSINDVRRLEDLRPAEGGDVYRVPLANVDLPAANLVELDKRALIAQRLVLSGYNPAEVLSAVGLPAIEHTGVPSVQLQNLSQLDPEAPKDAYEVE
jgi:HK97 family phage portal protein